MDLRAYLLENYPEDNGLLIVDGFDDAFIGVGTSFHRSFTCYDREKIIEILMQDMTYDEAVEHFDFNIGGAYVGENTPVFIDYVRYTGDGING